MIPPVLPQIHVLYENPAWIPPLQEALAREGFRVRLVHVNEGLVDPSVPPPEGVWINRISPSSHTRGHVHTVELARHLDGDGFDAGPGARMILQQYIDAPEPFITRVEIVGGRFVFAMRSSTAGGFELCPSDACNPMPCGKAEEADEVEEGTLQVCPTGPGLFSPSPVAEDDALVQRYIRLCNEEKIEIAGIEYVRDRWGHRYTYDINGTTNYNQTLGARIGVDGMGEVARYVRRTATPVRRRRRIAS